MFELKHGVPQCQSHMGEERLLCAVLTVQERGAGASMGLVAIQGGTSAARAQMYLAWMAFGPIRAPVLACLVDQVLLRVRR